MKEKRMYKYTVKWVVVVVVVGSEKRGALKLNRKKRKGDKLKHVNKNHWELE